MTVSLLNGNSVKLLPDYLGLRTKSGFRYVVFLTHDFRILIRSSAGLGHAELPASEVVVGQDDVTQGALLLGIVKFVVFLGTC